MARKSRLKTMGDIFELGTYVEDLKELAKESLLVYFKDKNYFCGGPIPRTAILKEENVDVLMHTNFDSFLYVHLDLLTRIPPNGKWEDPSVPWQVGSILALLRDMRSKALPKAFQPGLAILYFKICKGISILEPKDIKLFLQRANSLKE